MMEYPFVQCLRPQRIWNKYVKEHQLLPCGKCVACMNRKSSRNQRLCELEQLGTFNYTYFVGLSYRDSEIPVYELVPDDKPNFYFVKDKNPRSATFGQFVTDDSIYFGEKELYHMNRKVKIRRPKNHFSYLYYRDIQLFLKVLRKRIQQKYGQKIRYFVTGEYGPDTYRAHWHIIFFCETRLPAAMSARYLSQIWQKGFVSSDRCSGGGVSYTASYVNSSFALPSIYQNVKVSPFSRHSVKLGFETFAKQALSKIDSSLLVEETRCMDTSVLCVVDGRPKRFPIDTTYQNAIFSKPYRFESIKSDTSGVYFLRAYEHYSRVFSDFCPRSVKELTSHVYDYFIYNYGHLDSYDLAFCSLLDLNESDRLLPSETFFYRLYRFFLYSKRYIQCMNDDPDYWIKLVTFFDRKDYSNLCSFFEAQQAFYREEPFSDYTLALFYVNTFSLKKLEGVSAYNSFLNMHEQIHYKKLTRKRFNDAAGLLNS